MKVSSHDLDRVRQLTVAPDYIICFFFLLWSDETGTRRVKPSSFSHLELQCVRRGL